MVETGWEGERRKFCWVNCRKKWWQLKAPCQPPLFQIYDSSVKIRLRQRVKLKGNFWDKDKTQWFWEIYFLYTKASDVHINLMWHCDSTASSVACLVQHSSNTYDFSL